jgi:hypothetical protein
MGFKDVAALATRISLAGPVLYVGLSMALGPSGFVAWLQKLAHFLHERSVKAFQLRRFRLRPHFIPATEGTCRALRFTGVWLIIGAFLHIAGFLN